MVVTLVTVTESRSLALPATVRSRELVPAKLEAFRFWMVTLS